MENGQTTSPAGVKPLINKEELGSFYKKGLPEMIKTMILQPASGTLSLFTNRSDKTYAQTLILMGSVAVLYIILPYLVLPSQLKELIGFSAAIKIGITTIIFMLLVSAMAFAIKSISGKADFKNELLTGGLCAIPLTVLLVLTLLAKFFMSDDDMYGMAYNPAGLISRSIIFLLFAFYILLMFINIFQQSLKAGGTKDSLAWYLSPLAIFLSFYFTAKIGSALF